MAVRIKICGITSAEAADAAAACADFAGLVFHPRSPRFLSLEKAARLAARMRGRLKLVALVADASDDALAVIVAAAAPDLLQLHGGETPARAAAIRARFGLPVIKALAIGEAEDIARAGDFAGAADMLLFDARAPGQAMRGGGHGTPFDWQLLQGQMPPMPWLLAGGLTPDNVARAIGLSGAQMVDVSSGVETAPGIKSAALIAAFAAAARSALLAAPAPRLSA